MRFLKHSPKGINDPLEGLADSLENIIDALEGLENSLEGLSDSLEGLPDSLEGSMDTKLPFRPWAEVHHLKTLVHNKHSIANSQNQTSTTNKKKRQT